LVIGRGLKSSRSRTAMPSEAREHAAAMS
jgi:hypothetical protein